MLLEKRRLYLVARCEETSTTEPVATKLLRIAEKTRKEPSLKFTNLFYLMSDKPLRA